MAAKNTIQIIITVLAAIIAAALIIIILEKAGVITFSHKAHGTSVQSNTAAFHGKDAHDDDHKHLHSSDCGHKKEAAHEHSSSCSHGAAEHSGHNHKH